MPSYTAPHTLTPAANPAKRDDGGATRPYVLLDADPDRAAVVVSFGAFPAGVADTAPVFVAGVYALLLADDGTGPELSPAWDRYTHALAVGDSLTIGAGDAPMPGLRYTAALYVPADVDPTLYSLRLVAGEHGAPC